MNRARYSAVLLSYLVYSTGDNTAVGKALGKLSPAGRAKRVKKPAARVSTWQKQPHPLPFVPPSSPTAGRRQIRLRLRPLDAL